MHPPPMQSHYPHGPSELELKALRHADRKEKARLRMARKRAELKATPYQEQELAAQRVRMHHAKYRESHREYLRNQEARRRRTAYGKRFGPAALAAWLKSKCARCIAHSKKKLDKEAYDSSAETNDGDDGDEVGDAVDRITTR
ncbi:hypothetical protein B0H13DRAFT_2371834 [Mycena leptocephala]|nr:hypothetical protein B0H13DRAFT_2371834 [Mycena leptocephala]